MLVHLPIHVINFLNICDKNNSWAASPGASVDRLVQTSAALGFLLGFLLVWGRTRSFWAKFRGRRASGKTWEGKSRDHWAGHLSESVPITWWFRRAGVKGGWVPSICLLCSYTVPHSGTSSQKPRPHGEYPVPPTEPVHCIIVAMIIWRWSGLHSGKGDMDRKVPDLGTVQNLIGICVIVGWPSGSYLIYVQISRVENRNHESSFTGLLWRVIGTIPRQCLRLSQTTVGCHKWCLLARMEAWGAESLLDWPQSSPVFTLLILPSPLWTMTTFFCLMEQQLLETYFSSASPGILDENTLSRYLSPDFLFQWEGRNLSFYKKHPTSLYNSDFEKHCSRIYRMWTKPGWHKCKIFL